MLHEDPVRKDIGRLPGIDAEVASEDLHLVDVYNWGERLELPTVLQRF